MVENAESSHQLRLIWASPSSLHLLNLFLQLAGGGALKLVMMVSHGSRCAAALRGIPAYMMSYCSFFCFLLRLLHRSYTDESLLGHMIVNYYLFLGSQQPLRKVHSGLVANAAVAAAGPAALAISELGGE
jgi:hypothetical protein